MLCCMGYSPRGNGQHCLRYDYSRPYLAFRVLQAKLMGSFVVSVASNQNTTRFTLTQDSPFQQMGSIQVVTTGPVSRLHGP